MRNLRSVIIPELYITRVSLSLSLSMRGVSSACRMCVYVGGGVGGIDFKRVSHHARKNGGENKRKTKRKKKKKEKTKEQKEKRVFGRPKVTKGRSPFLGERGAPLRFGGSPSFVRTICFVRLQLFKICTILIKHRPLLPSPFFFLFFFPFLLRISVLFYLIVR